MSGHKNGFSLVELSIVLVILGLLTGGILGGQALIKAAELRAVTTELNTWQTAMNTFKGKYMGIPGDLRNAGRFWGYINTAGAGGNCSAPATNTGTGTQTCDGNGNGTFDQTFEIFRFWQHLANAGLINGEFTGIAGSGSTQHAEIGRNVPTSKWGSAGWGVRTLGDSPGFEGFFFRGNYGSPLYVGGEWFDALNDAPVMSPEDAWNIDTKIDDGKPTKGSVFSSQTTSCTDAANKDDIADTEYLLSDTGTRCSLYFMQAVQ
jgi:prepilin-type N-terminal cleavage/methylation domain-containing protein